MEIKFPNIFKLFLIALIVSSCGNNDLDLLPTFSKNNVLQAIVEIPAGTNHKLEYNYNLKKIIVDSIEGKKRIIDFLPYPGNYGFIPSTKMDKQRGGDGDALDVLIISESQVSGSIIEIIPIGVLLLNDSGEIDTKIIAIPFLEEIRIIKVRDFNEFSLKYPKVKQIIEDWFLNYKGKGRVELLGWSDENAAYLEVKKWQNN
ncbi:MAG: inorganic diphosphatase [Bacteroidales bacterium]|nr:inorganic diphosphatase [Bacteroidales bacterium]